jgi:hypothetical protein
MQLITLIESCNQKSLYVMQITDNTEIQQNAFSAKIVNDSTDKVIIVKNENNERIKEVQPFATWEIFKDDCLVNIKLYFSVIDRTEIEYMAFNKEGEAVNGIDGSIQYKNVLGQLFGDAFLLWKNRILSIFGNLEVTSTSSIVGNAFEVKNSNNVNLRTINSKGEETKSISTQAVGRSLNNSYVDIGISNIINYIINTVGGVNMVGEDLSITASGIGSNPSRVVGRRTTLNLPQSGGNYHNVASWNELTGTGNGTAGYFSNCLSVGNLPVYYNSPVVDNKGYIGMKATGVDTGLDINYYAQEGGMQTTLRLDRDAEPNPNSNMLAVNDGMQIRFKNFIDRTFNSPNPGANDTITLDYLGVRIKDTTQFLATTEMFFKTTQNGVSIEALTLNGNKLKISTADGGIGFYGTTPIAKQNLLTIPTPEEIAIILQNLGLVNLI